MFNAFLFSMEIAKQTHPFRFNVLKKKILSFIVG